MTLATDIGASRDEGSHACMHTCRPCTRARLKLPQVRLGRARAHTLAVPVTCTGTGTCTCNLLVILYGNTDETPSAMTCRQPCLGCSPVRSVRCAVLCAVSAVSTQPYRVGQGRAGQHRRVCSPVVPLSRASGAVYITRVCMFECKLTYYM